MICEEFPTLVGRQEPHNLSVFPGDLTHGDKSIELARRAGAISMPWQKMAQQSILSMTPDGRWTHADCCLIIPRQNGKSEILILRCLYGLFKLGETILYTAQRWKTARDAWKRMMSIIKSRPWLNRRVTRSTCSQGEGIIDINGGSETEGGSTISFGTRSNDSGRGLTVIDVIVYDEAYNLTEGEISATAFTQMAAQNPQTIYASSAVNQDEHPNGAVLAAVRNRGLKGEDGLYFAEYMAPDEMDRDDAETWIYANPSFGVIQTEAKVLDIKRRLSTVAGKKGFDVEALGRGDWPVEEDRPTWSIISEENWTELHDPTPNLVGPRAIAIDRQRNRSLWVIAAAQRTDTDRIHIEIGYCQVGSHEQILKLLLGVVGAWDPCVLVTDSKSTAKALEPLLTTAGIELVKTTTSQIADSTGAFVDDAEDFVLSHSNQPVLNEAARDAVPRTLPAGDYVFNMQMNTVVAPLNAAQMARWGLLTYGSRVTAPAAIPKVERSTESTGSWAGSRAYETSVDQFDALAAGF